MLVYICRIDKDSKLAFACNPAYKANVDSNRPQILVKWSTDKTPQEGLTYQCSLICEWVDHNLVHGEIINPTPIEDRVSYII